MMAELNNNKLPAHVQRFNIHQRLQHLLLAVSVLMLIVTGFPIKYGHTGWAATVIGIFGSFEKMFNVHLFFAVVMIISGAYHLIWLIGLFAKQGPVLTMMPRWKDVTDAIHHYKYMLGLTRTPPQFDRYTYLEKFEYFAVVWGIFVMGFSGFILWYPRMFTWLPRWMMDVARVVHTNEAFVAMLALFMGHFFAVHFNPKVFPTSRVWLNGKISVEHLAEEHPLEYRKLLQERGLPESAAAHELHASGFGKSMALIVVEILVYGTIVVAVLVTFLKLLFK